MNKKLIIILIITLLLPINSGSASFIGDNKVYIASFNDDDGDGLNNFEEINIYKTDPNNIDTDNDGYNDYEEVINGYSPINSQKIKNENLDTDNDGLNDKWEIIIGSDILNIDTDGDGFSDYEEVMNGYSPISSENKKIGKRIEIDIDKFELKYYFGDKLLETFLISSGRKDWETPRGEFNVLNKVPIKNYYGHPNTPYNLEFTFNKGWKVYIHQANWHNEFGIKNVSTGCINVPVNKMKQLYDFAEIGTNVVVK